MSMPSPPSAPPSPSGVSQAPVVVSRIQNRRGTQDQFDNLYPVGYTGVGGFGSISGFNITNFPLVLMPGELAFCTDSRRLFIGNVNGEYVEISAQVSGGLLLSPVLITLPPTPTPTVIPALSYQATPFNNLFYSITDSASLDWDTVGTNFSRNGILTITAIAPGPSNSVNLSDTGTEINNSLPSTISFSAGYDISNTNIQILYTHNFSTSVGFSSSSVKWLPF